MLQNDEINCANLNMIIPFTDRDQDYVCMKQAYFIVYSFSMNRNDLLIFTYGILVLQHVHRDY